MHPALLVAAVCFPTYAAPPINTTECGPRTTLITTELGAGPAREGRAPSRPPSDCEGALSAESGLEPGGSKRTWADGLGSL